MALTGARIPAGCDTVAKLFRHTATARGERVALMHKDYGVWQATTWRGYAEQARHQGLGLAALGLQHLRLHPRPRRRAHPHLRLRPRRHQHRHRHRSRRQSQPSTRWP